MRVLSRIRLPEYRRNHQERNRFPLAGLSSFNADARSRHGMSIINSARPRPHPKLISHRWKTRWWISGWLPPDAKLGRKFRPPHLFMISIIRRCARLNIPLSFPDCAFSASRRECGSADSSCTCTHVHTRIESVAKAPPGCATITRLVLARDSCEFAVARARARAAGMAGDESAPPVDVAVAVRSCFRSFRRTNDSLLT